MQFSRSIFIFRFVHVFQSEFASGVKDVTFVLIYIFVLIIVCRQWPFLIEFAGGFIMFFIRGNKKRSEGDQSVTGISRLVQAQNTLAD